MRSYARLGPVARRNVVRQRRLFATPPSTTPPPPPPVGARIPPGPVVPAPAPAGTTMNIPPPRVPPPPSPQPPARGIFRRLIIYTTVGIITFYPLSGWISTQSETYRDFFASTVPGGETVAEYADEHGWETFGFGTISKKAVEGWQYVTGEDKKPDTIADRVATRAREAQRSVQSGASQVKAEAKSVKQEAERKVASATSAVKSATNDAANKLSSTAKDVQAKTDNAVSRDTSKAADTATSMRDRAVAATQDAADKARALAATAQAKVAEATGDVPFNFSEGVEGMVREAERVLGQGVDRVEAVGETVKEKIEETPGPKGFLDAQKPRELRPDTVQPKKISYEGQTAYAGPPLPLGFEPPPGYYIAPPPPPKANQAGEIKQTLPLLVPKVKEFAASEPIISQLASTIDSLTHSLSTPTSDSNGILSKAHDDLSALNQRLEDVKRIEKERLEQTLAVRAQEFQETLRDKEEERTKGEQGLREGWDKERSKMVNEWRSALETELESQREGIEQRLREEVVSQGIELQRRWLRSIKTQVETERGGRLAKLDTLTTSLKQLERITLDNSASLDDNIRLHKVWSALRAVQAKTEKGDMAFDDELRVLRALSTPVDNSSIQPDAVVIATLGQLEASGIPQTGVKSFAALSSWFTNSVAPRCQSASLVPPPQEATVLTQMTSAILSKIMFTHKAGPVEGDDVNSILARVEWCLGEKDLDGAAREANSLRGWPGRLAKDWLREARRRLEVMQALDIVGTEATLSSLLLV